MQYDLLGCIKLYISSTLNNDLNFWLPQKRVVAAVEYQIMFEIMGYFFHFPSSFGETTF